MDHRTETRPMDRSELQTVLSWAAEEGWNPGLNDAEPFHAADPFGFFLTSVGGTPIASVSVVNHSAEHAFLGLYICRPDKRGQGLGLVTWQFGIEHAGSRLIGLDGVPEQESNYKASGFIRTGSTLRNEGRVDARQSQNVRPASSSDLQFLISLDGSANGFMRPRFMSAWIAEVDGARETRVLLRDGAICGFATWRACRNGTKVGPIIAPDVSGSLELLRDIAVLRPDGPLIVDVPEGNMDLRRELEGAGFSVPFVTARMYRGQVPHGDRTLQAIATMELG